MVANCYEDTSATERESMSLVLRGSVLTDPTGRRMGDGLRVRIASGVTSRICAFDGLKRGRDGDGLLGGSSGTTRAGSSFDSTTALAGAYDGASTKSQGDGSGGERGRWTD